MIKLRHLAIIMDGNGRYAKKHNQVRTKGHLDGANNIRDIAIEANNNNIEVCTLYAFSTENWNRPIEEVNYLMSLPSYFINKYLKELIDNNIKIEIIGDSSKLPIETLNVLNKAINDTKESTGMKLVFAVNYGFKQEMIFAIKDIIKDQQPLDNIDEQLIESYLMTKDYPDVDLLIRTSGEQRVSNFLLWQIAYSEIMFIKKNWPEFNKNDLKECIDNYYHRSRTFGALNNEN